MPMARGPLIESAARLAVLLLAMPWVAAHGAEPGVPRTDLQAEAEAAFEAAGKAAQRGPVAVPLASQAKLQMPKGFSFIPKFEAERLMKAFGNTLDSGFQGMIVPHAEDHSFSFYDVTYHGTGYIKDDDARSWDADKLLGQVREGTDEANKHRRQMGLPEVELTGWVEKPSYDAATHHLVWSIGARDKGAASGEGDVINYKTLVLGREGYVSMTLVTDRAHVDALRPATATLLDGLTFDDGKRYSDFNASTDHVAEFGLAALVAGVAAKKLGLLALAAAFVVKFAKVIGVAVVGAAVLLRKWLGLRRKDPVPPAPASSSGPAA